MTPTFLTLLPISVQAVGQPLKRDELWAWPCLPGALYFIFRS